MVDLDEDVTQQQDFIDEDEFSEAEVHYMMNQRERERRDRIFFMYLIMQQLCFQQFLTNH